MSLKRKVVALSIAWIATLFFAIPIHMIISLIGPVLIVIGLNQCHSKTPPFNRFNLYILIQAVIAVFGSVFAVKYAIGNDAPAGMMLSVMYVLYLFEVTTTFYIFKNIHIALRDATKRRKSISWVGLNLSMIILLVGSLAVNAYHDYRFRNYMKDSRFLFCAVVNNGIPKGVDNISIVELDIDEYPHYITIEFHADQSGINRILNSREFDYMPNEIDHCHRYFDSHGVNECDLLYWENTQRARFTLYGHFRNAITQLHDEDIDDLHYEEVVRVAD